MQITKHWQDLYLHFQFISSSENRTKHVWCIVFVLVGAGQYCQICEVIVSYVEKLLNNNTEAEIVSLVDHLCSYLGSYKAEVCVFG